MTTDSTSHYAKLHLEEMQATLTSTISALQEAIPEAATARQCQLLWDVPVLSLRFIGFEERGEPVTKQVRDGEIITHTTVTVPRLPQEIYTRYVSPIRPLLRLLWGCSVYDAMQMGYTSRGLYLSFTRPEATWKYFGWSVQTPIEVLWPQAEAFTHTAETALNVCQTW